MGDSRRWVPGRTATDASPAAPDRMLTKVPEITIWFWVIKVLSTAMGEALSDFLDGGTGIVLPALGVLVALVAFVVALRRQLRTRRYVSAVYWFAVAMVATFGTMAADSLHQALAIPYYASTGLFAAILAIIFWRWHRSEGTLSIHSIDTPRRERFYWATVLATFALGTAGGDMTATDLNLGFLVSGLLFAAVIVLPAIGWRVLRMHAIFAFWFAYIVTRPLGASFADWLDVPAHRGLGLGTGPVALVLALMMAIVVVGVRASGRDRQVVPGQGRGRLDPLVSRGAQLVPDAD